MYANIHAKKKFGDKDCAPVGEIEEFQKSKSKGNGKGEGNGKEKEKDRRDLAAIAVDDLHFSTAEIPVEAARDTDGPSIKDFFG